MAAARDRSLSCVILLEDGLSCFFPGLRPDSAGRLLLVDPGKTESEGLLASSPLVFVGEVSFALYLVHMPILVAHKGVAAELRGIDSGVTTTTAELAGLLILTSLVSVALHLFIRGLAGRRSENGLNATPQALSLPRIEARQAVG